MYGPINWVNVIIAVVHPCSYNGNYIALRELSLSYKLPSILVQKAKLSNVELSITGQNLGYLTEAKHLF